MNVFTDSFSHYSTLAQLQSKWNGGTSNGCAVGASFAIGAASQGMLVPNSMAYRNLGVNLATGVFGARFRLATAGVYGTLVVLLDTGTAQLYVNYNTAGGVLTLFRGNGTSLGSATVAIAVNTIHTIELVPVISTSGGSCQVFIDNVLVLTVSGANTSNSGNAWFNQIGVGSTNQNSHWADVYVNDFSGAAMNARLGTWSIKPFTVAAAGAYAQFTPAGTILGANWQQLAKALADATSFVQSNVLNNRDSFGMAPVTVGTIVGARQWLYAQKDSSGLRSVALTLSNSVDQIGSSIPLAGGSYQFYSGDASLDPSTGALWASLAALNAALSGYKITV